MLRRYQAIFVALLLAMCLSGIAACSTIGVKERVRIVYVGLAVPTEIGGAVKIATNKPLPVTIDGAPDIDTKLDVGGWYAVPPGDLEELLKLARE